MTLANATIFLFNLCLFILLLAESFDSAESYQLNIEPMSWSTDRY
jgi:hypothetical protein